MSNSYIYQTVINGTATTTNNLLWNGPGVYTEWPTVYHEDPLGYRVWVDPVAEGTAIPESDFAWLKRRVKEVCWVPA